MGQGIGPIHDPDLLEKARVVLPRASLISLREETVARPLLLQLGVAPERIAVTGDDSLELAYRHRAPALGSEIGVNLRAADYAGVTREVIPPVRRALRRAAERTGAMLRSIPVALASSPASACDVAIADELISGTSARGPRRIVNTPQDLAVHISDCRLVVTGSYHAAVLALGQGVPAICLTNSEYYRVKFGGLVDQFGDGCTVLGTDGDLEEHLFRTVERIWSRADALGSSILEAAQRHIWEGHRAYRRLQSVVEEERSSRALSS
jgi:colanic acid/amylovoran biosynthesis protein